MCGLVSMRTVAGRIRCRAASSCSRSLPTTGCIAWFQWDHPDMPWDSSRLRTAAVAPDGTIDEPALAAGGPDESIAQPEWSPEGILHFVSDRTGWWNLYRLLDGPALDPLGPMEA